MELLINFGALMAGIIIGVGLTLFAAYTVEEDK